LSILISIFLYPFILYPFILWVMFTGITFVRGKTEGMVSRVAMTGAPEGHADLDAALRKEKGSFACSPRIVQSITKGTPVRPRWRSVDQHV
jgi:hypothetical protein